MNKRLSQYLILTTVIVIAVVGFFIFSRIRVKPDYQLNQFDLSQVKGVTAAKLKTSPVPHLVLQNKNTNSAKYVFSTADCGIIKHGYNNRVELFVVFNSQGRVENVILGKNVETPERLEKIYQCNFLQQWNGSNKQPKVQHVTGATYSSKAIIGGISELLDLLKRKKFFK